MNRMTNNLRLLWERLTASEVRSQKEIKNLRLLQLAANNRHMEYAAMQADSAVSPGASLKDSLCASRKVMEDADRAHMIALQKWENRLSRQKSY
jgi:hypothetical protein